MPGLHWARKGVQRQVNQVPVLGERARRGQDQQQGAETGPEQQAVGPPRAQAALLRVALGLDRKHKKAAEKQSRCRGYLWLKNARTQALGCAGWARTGGALQPGCRG